MVRLAIFLLLATVSSPAYSQKRVALVIGIDRYDNLPDRAQLKKARADATAIAAALSSIGFDVIHKHDVTRATFNGHWQDFLNKLSPGDTAALFFAGHGVELGGRNYLLPRDVPHLRPGRDELLKRESLSVQEFIADLREKGTRFNLVILDACRDNPFEPVAGRSVGSARGLAVSEPPEGTFIMFSAGSGESALDRLDDADGDLNSVYTRQLLPLLTSPGATLTEVAEQVRVSVRQMASTVQHRQTPAYYSQLIGRVCLVGACASAAAIPQPPPSRQQSEAAEAWDRVKDSSSIPVLEAFARHYSTAFYANLARERIKDLRAASADVTPVKPAAAPAPPPSPPPAAPKPCVVADPTGTPLNVRATPQGAIVSTLSNGSPVRITGSQNDFKGQPWAHIAKVDGTHLGWVIRRFVSCP